MSAAYHHLAEVYTNENALAFLVHLDLRLAREVGEDEALDYALIFTQLDGLLKRMLLLERNEETALEPNSDESAGATSPMKVSATAVKAFSRTMITVLEKLPSKTFDLANNLLGELLLDYKGHLTSCGQIACIVLIDIFETYPLQVASLINFAAAQIYKILKKNSVCSATLVSLLSTVIEGALKSDIDEKFLAKLVKLVLKTILQHSISVGVSQDAEIEGGSSIPIITCYVQLLKDLLILQVSSHYERLLEISTSATSGSKLKPETMMAQQDLYQQAILSSHEKSFLFGLQSPFSEVRCAMVDLLAKLLINFVAAGEFNASKYLLGLYPLPDINLWNQSLTCRVAEDGEPILEIKKDSHLNMSQESEAITTSNLNMRLLQVGVVESYVFYIQLELLQNKDFLPSSLTSLIDSILFKFNDMSHVSHIQNGAWDNTLSQWSKVVRFLIIESGALSHDTLARYVMLHFSSSHDEASRAEISGTGKAIKEKRRESGLFGFKGLKKSKKKGLDKCHINLYTNPYQLKLALDIVSILLPFNVDFNSLVHTKSGDHVVDADGDEDEVDEDENKSTTKRSNYVSELLLCLLSNESEYIRNYSLICLLEYAALNQSECNRLGLELFSLISQEFNAQNLKETAALPTERNISRSGTTKLFAYSLALLALVKQADITLFQNSTIATILSFCTQNLKHNSSLGLKNIKNGACWVILSALVTFYHESEFVKLNSSQFLVFWKNMLTSQFSTSALSGDSTLGDTQDVILNLKLRSFSLLCLLNYISAVEATSEILKQLQFLLTKSYKYLVFLEGEYESVGLVTRFHPQAFDEWGFSPSLVHSALFSNYSNSAKVSSDQQLASLLLYNKKLVMQGFVRIAHSLKGEVNSSLVILLLKIFSDVKLFSRVNFSDYSRDKSKVVRKQTTSKLAHIDDEILFFEEDRYYNFGVTSKFQYDIMNIDQLCYDNSSEFLFDTYRTKDPFVNTSMNDSDLPIEAFASSNVSNWVDSFESLHILAACHSVNFDPAMLILHRYSLRSTYSPNLITSLVDHSIELFQLTFSSLTYKIQFSILEQLRSTVCSKQIDPLRRKAVMVNVNVALHGLLNHVLKQNVSLSEDLVLLLLDIIEWIDLTDPASVSICADLVGLATRLLPKSKKEEFISTMIGKIVSDTSPYIRGRHILSLAMVNNYSHIGFIEIHDILTQLIKDAHPVISYYSQIAASILFENPLGNQSLIEGILNSTYINFVSDSLCMSNSNAQYTNLHSKYNFAFTNASLFRVCITSLGPRIKECHFEMKSKIFQVLFLLSHGIRSSSMKDFLISISKVLLTCQEVIIFDRNLTDGFDNWYKDFALAILRANLKTGIGIIRPTSVNFDRLFSMTTSSELYRNALTGLGEMTKIGIRTLDKDSLNLAWILMEIRPCTELESLISFWIDSNTEAQWFNQLTRLFSMSSRKLIGKFMEVQYQQKLLPLQQRHKKTIKDANFNFADEEAQNIVESEGEAEDQIQPINWVFRLLIYDLLNKILSEAKKGARPSSNLEQKIQEIVRISFLGTTAPIVSIKLKGVDLLSNALDLFGHLEDPLYPGVSILEQQQAQIISALIPCFSSDSDVSVIVEAIDVSSKFINLPRINFYSKQRILRTMIYLLEEVSSNKFLKFVHLESMTEYGRKAIQLSILNCWAVLYVNFAGDCGVSEPEFEEILQKYSKLLISLWILVLKELSNLKYTQPNSKELRLYENYWLNFVGVLSLILEKDASAVQEFLLEEEENFFFVLFCQCSEALIKNHNVSKVLVSVNRLVRVHGLARVLFCDEIFDEVISLLDRLVLMEKEIETKCQVIDTVNALFESFLESTDGTSADKYFELLRVAMLPLFEIFPFLRQNFDPDEESSKLFLKRCDTETSLLMANKQFSVLAQMVRKFPDDSRSDLVSCMLYVIAKFFEFGNDALIGTVLPFLKSIISQARSSETDLLSPFVDILKANGLFGPIMSRKTHIITMVILITGGNIALGDDETLSFAQTLVDGITDKELASVSIQSIRSVMNHAGVANQASTKITKDVLKAVLDSLLNNEDQEEAILKVKLEIIYVCSQSQWIDTRDKGTAIISLLVPLLLKFDAQGVLSRDYLHEKMVGIMNNRMDSFKQVVKEQLDDEQRRAAEALVTYSKHAMPSVEHESIQLRTFT